jgi:SAM-dependent methyltransferase
VIAKKRKQSGQSQHASWAKHYDKVNELSFGKSYVNLTQATLSLINGIGQKLSIVDFGAGTGRLSLPLASEGHRVTAVEPSKAMLAELDRKDIRNLITKRCSTIEDYRGRGGFDLALAVYSVISYVTDTKTLQASFENVAGKLKPGGYFVLDIPHAILFHDGKVTKNGITRSVRFVDKGNELYEYQEETELTVEDKLVRYSDKTMLRHWTEAEIVAALESAGFRAIRHVTEDDLSLAGQKDDLDLSGAVYLICRRPLPDLPKPMLDRTEVGGKFVLLICVCLMGSSFMLKKRSAAKMHAEEDMRKAVASAVEKKDARALNEYGWDYQIGEKVDSSFIAAYYCWSEAAKLDDADAQAFLAFAHYYGEGTPKNITEGLRLAQLSAESGSIEGAYSFGRLSFSNFLSSKNAEDSARAFQWISKSAHNRHATAMALLAMFYKYKVGTQKDPTEAYKWFILWKECAWHDRHRTSSEELLENFLDSLTPEQKAEGQRRADLARPILNSSR